VRLETQKDYVPRQKISYELYNYDTGQQITINGDSSLKDIIYENKPLIYYINNVKSYN
jgi:hypothetical protein